MQAMNLSSTDGAGLTVSSQAKLKANSRGHAVVQLEDAQFPEVRLNSCLISQRLLSKTRYF